MLLQDRARAGADATHRDTGVARNTSDSCWSARELLEAKEREQLLQLQARQAKHEQGQDRARAGADATHGDTGLMLLQDRARAEADATRGDTRLMLLLRARADAGASAVTLLRLRPSRNIQGRGTKRCHSRRRDSR